MTDLIDLAERVEAAKGADRELDAEIAEAFGWKPVRIGPDAFGENDCEVLTPDGGPYLVNGERWNYPPKGKVHRAYHCPAFTRDCLDPAFPKAAVRQKTAQMLRALAQEKANG